MSTLSKRPAFDRLTDFTFRCTSTSMSYRHLELSSSADGTSESPPESDQTLNGFINKAAHSLVYKSMAVLLSIRLDIDGKDETWKSEYPVGDEIGRILKMIGLVLAVMFVISFVIIPSTVVIVLCCCQQSPASGILTTRLVSSSFSYIPFNMSINSRQPLKILFFA